MTLTQPIWLLLLIPLALSLFVWQVKPRVLGMMRGVALVLLLLALSGASTSQMRRAGVLVVLADRSLSMPKQVETQHKELIDQLLAKMGRHERLAVVSFGRQALVERPPQQGAFAGFQTKVDREGSNLSDAIRLGMALIPTGQKGRLLVVSDGRWTGRPPSQMAARAAARGIPIDTYTLKRDSVNDIALLRLQTPEQVTPGESFMMSAWVQVPIAQKVRFVLMRGKTPISIGERRWKAGTHRLLFRDRAGGAGSLSYVLKVSGTRSDPVPENNQIRTMVGVKGVRPVLHVAPTKRSTLGALLRTGKVAAVTKTADQVSWDLASLRGYSTVLLENISSEEIGRVGMENLKSWVKQTGSGLMITGGMRSYARGGYIRSPLEPILPVSMRLRQEHRKMFLALAIVLDRSCSMGAPAGGKTKMDLANLASVQALDLLSPMDQVAVLAVDSAVHTIAPLSQLTDKNALKDDILAIASAGGGIFVYDGLKAAYDVLRHAKPQTRHVLLFSDAADSEQPGSYQQLIRDGHKQNITVSVIGLGKDTDSDADFLKDVAKRGKGRIFFTEDPLELPRLFAQDTMMVTKQSFIKEPTKLRWAPGLGGLTRLSFPALPGILGYNLTYARKEAQVAAQIVGEKPRPLIAFWNVGLGRVLAYTGELDGVYAGPMATWPKIGDLVTSLTRWTAGASQDLPVPMTLTQRVEDGMALVELKLDPETHHAWLKRPPLARVLKGAPGEKPKTQTLAMQWQTAHQLSLRFPLSGKEVALTTVLLPGNKPYSLPPLVQPYSAEFRPVTRRQEKTLARLASLSKGKPRLEVSGLWKDIPAHLILGSIGHWLLLLALLLFLCEILERRVGVLGASMTSLRASAKARAETNTPAPAKNQALAEIRAAKEAAKARTSSPEKAFDPGQVKATEVSGDASASAPVVESEPPASPKPRQAGAAGGMFGALQEASKQAKKRTDR